MPFRPSSNPGDRLDEDLASSTPTKPTTIAAAVAPWPAATSKLASPAAALRAAQGLGGIDGWWSARLLGSASFAALQPVTSAEPTSTSLSPLSPQPSSPGASSNSGSVRSSKRSWLRSLRTSAEPEGVLNGLWRTRLELVLPAFPCARAAPFKERLSWRSSF